MILNFLFILNIVISGPIKNNLVSDMKLMGRFAGAASCLSLYGTNTTWNCGNICGGDSAGTKIVKAKLNKRTQGAYQITTNDNHNLIVISFRGTKHIVNVISDADFGMSEDWNEDTMGDISFLGPNSKPLPDGLKIHRGIEALYVTMRNEINPIVKSLADNNPRYQIVYTGHSLGGALAVFGAVDFESLYGNGDRISIYTFGQPRVGNDAWTKYMGGLPFVDRIYRFAIKGDPVVQLAPMWTGYRHHLRQYMVEDNGSITPCPIEVGTGESKDCIWTLAQNNMNLHSKYDFGGNTQNC